jgi:hypothetical protein
MSKKRSFAICCFCSEKIPAMELLIIKLIQTDECHPIREQLFYSHKKCIRDSFAKDVSLPILVALNDNDGEI